MFPVFFPYRPFLDRPARLLSIRGVHRFPSSLWWRSFTYQFGSYARADAISHARNFALNAARYRQRRFTLASVRREI
jgi:hypothetical protein